MLEFSILYLLDFASLAECEHLRGLIDRIVKPHSLAPKNLRTNAAGVAWLTELNDSTVQSIDARFAKAIGVAPELSEGSQGQRYEVGDYYAEHYDAFEPSYPECARHLEERGQRTFTATLYLNSMAQGGELKFPGLGVIIRPRAGLAVVWYNLNRAGEPHPLSVHSASPPLMGRKYILSCWFRERRMPLERGASA